MDVASPIRSRPPVQCLDAGPLDELHIDLVPLLLGSGIPLFDQARNAPMVLGDPTVVAGGGVTHRRYPYTTTRGPDRALL